MTAEIGSIVCKNCGAGSDEPCAEWCAVQDPRIANRAQKLREAAEALTDGSSISPASSKTRLPGGVQAPSVNASDIEY
jgi:hypothetical protein